MEETQESLILAFKEYNEGADCYSRHLYGEARQHFLEALKIKPDLVAARFLLEHIPEDSNILNIDGEG